MKCNSKQQKSKYKYNRKSYQSSYLPSLLLSSPLPILLLLLLLPKTTPIPKAAPVTPTYIAKIKDKQKDIAPDVAATKNKKAAIVEGL